MLAGFLAALGWDWFAAGAAGGEATTTMERETTARTLVVAIRSDASGRAVQLVAELVRGGEWVGWVTEGTVDPARQTALVVYGVAMLHNLRGGALTV